LLTLVFVEALDDRRPVSLGEIEDRLPQRVAHTRVPLDDGSHRVSSFTASDDRSP